MGIGGSGISAVAQIAYHQGFIVSGCDQQTDTPYITKVKKLGIPVFSGHDPKHLNGVDILAVSPAVFYQSAQHPELTKGQRKKILMTWQEFLGKYLHNDKFLICIAGTHGKSTTTTLAGLLLENAGLDPTVEVGATVPDWHSNIRLGKGKYFISEADEFYNNFLHYHPHILIITSLEMDHPDFFPTKSKLLNSFKKLVLNLQPPKILIINTNFSWSNDLLKVLNTNRTKVIKYDLGHVNEISQTPTKTTFTYLRRQYALSIPGKHNISNSLGVIQLGRVLKIPHRVIARTLKSFQGIGRRMEIVGQKRGVTVLDDYAVHPTAYFAALSALKQKYPHRRIWAIIEPHTFSRNQVLLPQFAHALDLADQVIISQIFASREKDPGNFSGADIATTTKHPHARYIPDFDNIAKTISLEAKSKDIVVIFGAGNSHQLSRQILDSL